MYYLFIFTIITIFLLIFFYQKEYFTTKSHIYMFWTGGYDSTFRLCQALLDEDKVITPIYISYKHLDNLPNKTYKRKSHKNEIMAMNNIKKMLKKKNPYKYKNLKSTIIIPHLNINNQILSSMKNLWLQGKNHRSLSQYGGLAQVSLDINKPVEIAVEKSRHSTMRNMVINDIINDNGVYKLKPINNDLSIFKNLVFPTINISKKDMLNIAKTRGYDDILSLTWSCWFPINGQPCKKCPMCQQRII